MSKENTKTGQDDLNDFYRWAAALQEAILEQERATFSATVRQEYRQPQNVGVLEDADGYGCAIGSCGDTMQFFLELDGERIEQAVFMTDGCGPTIACGSMMTRMVQGKSLNQAAAIEAAELLIALDGLPPEHIHCATLAVNTLNAAIDDCRPAEEGGDTQVQMG